MEGERLEVRAFASVGELAEGDEPLDATVEEAAAEIPEFEIPTETANADWTQKGGNSAHFVLNPALGGNLTQLWSANIGSGDSRKHRLSADPVVADGRVFTLDSRSQVKAHSTAGAALWSADLTPGSERNADASGGGLAFGDGRVYATTGFGSLVALDAATGAELWVQDTDSAVAGPPTFADGLVYTVSRDNRAWALDAETGRIRWQLPGTPSPSGLIGGAAPVVTDRVAVFPLSSSELVAALKKSGVRVWASPISGQRRGTAYTSVSDLSGDPVFTGDRVYAGTQSGRTVAVTASGGQRLWTAEEGAYSPVVPAGNSVFLVTDQAELVRLDAETGERVWGFELPYFVKERPRRLKSVFAHYGPILAGGRLIVVSDDGQLREFDPQDGTLLKSTKLRSGAASNPVVAGGTLYLVTTNGQLHAFR
ncbi:quinoprotein [Actibacterium mucosum KCTC 23349]|uniref:Quinoprotein n=1 Tax=Actibacterium mucosum KCTC 23349 TaxID=1454373 RepID=A0A037ZJB1_9RHOB|nr:quinoprotein [Actibacterium mucosum KCTC 23349]